MNKNNLNLIAAFALSLLILLAWEYFYDIPQNAKRLAAHPERSVQERETSVDNNARPRSAPAAEEEQSREAVIAHGNRITITSDELHGSINLKGAKFDDLTLAKYRQSVAQDAPEVVLLAPSSTADVYFAQFGWLSGDKTLVVPDNDTVWTSDDSELTPQHPVTLTWDSPQKLRFTLTIALDAHFMFTVTQGVENLGTSSASLSHYGLINRTHTTGKSYFILHEGALGVVNGTLEELTYKKLKKESDIESKDANGWLGITDKYWLTAIIPPASEHFTAHYGSYVKGNQDRFQVDTLGAEHSIKPGETLNEQNYFFAGAKQVKLLDSYRDSLHIPLFDRAVDFGWLYFITKPMFYALDYFYEHIGNFGLAIMALTIIVKLILFPLASKSYTSMSQMKNLQPEIARLKERHGADKTKLNQAVMEFYKKERINPLSGCLPMLIQVPIFFSLYKVLFVTIEMRHAPFFGWVKDLSAPDPTNIFNLFGLIPLELPSFIPHIGLWPLIMMGTMIIQQRLNPAPPDPVQAQVMKLLPFVFLFVFAPFPAGLIIYWAWNNSLSILQQTVITKRVAAKNAKVKARAASKR